MNDGSNAWVYSRKMAGVSRSGSTVMNTAKNRSLCLPSRRFTLAARVNAVGQTSGHWVKPKKTSTALPRKSATARSLPSGACKRKSCPYGAPVMSIAWKRASASLLRSQPASSDTEQHRMRSDNARQRLCGKKRISTHHNNGSIGGVVGRAIAASTKLAAKPVSYRMGLPGATP